MVLAMAGLALVLSDIPYEFINYGLFVLVSLMTLMIVYLLATLIKK
jgi:hypothetical protein